MNMFLMDPDGISEANPYQGQITPNLTPGGANVPVYQPRSEIPDTRPGRSPRGGIDYIDQAVGGVAGVRDDVMAGPRSGIRSYRSRTQPFNGEFIGARTISPGNIPGPVGQRHSTTVQRATSVQRTNLPDSGNVLAGFTNPAMAAMLRLFRKEDD